MTSISDIAGSELSKLAVERWPEKVQVAGVDGSAAALIKDIYRRFLMPNSASAGGNKQQSKGGLSPRQLLEYSSYLEHFLWPHFVAASGLGPSSSSASSSSSGAVAAPSFEHVFSIILMVNEKAREGVPLWNWIGGSEGEGTSSPSSPSSPSSSSAFSRFFLRVLLLRAEPRGFFSSPSVHHRGQKPLEPPASKRQRRDREEQQEGGEEKEQQTAASSSSSSAAQQRVGLSPRERLAWISFLSLAFSSLEQPSVRSAVAPLLSLPLWLSMSPQRLELELALHPQLRKPWARLLKDLSGDCAALRKLQPQQGQGEAEAEGGSFGLNASALAGPQLHQLLAASSPSSSGDSQAAVPLSTRLQRVLAATFVPSLLADLLVTLETTPTPPSPSPSGNTPHHHQQQQQLRYVERSLALLVELLSQLPTRRFLRTLLSDCHFLLRVRAALPTMLKEAASERSSSGTDSGSGPFSEPHYVAAGVGASTGADDNSVDAEAAVKAGQTAQALTKPLLPAYLSLSSSSGSTGSSSSNDGVSGTLALANQLLAQLDFTLSFPVDDHSGQQLSETAVSAAHYSRVQALQRVLYNQRYGDKYAEARELALSAVGTLSPSVIVNLTLPLPTRYLLSLVRHLRLLPAPENTRVLSFFMGPVHQARKASSSSSAAAVGSKRRRAEAEENGAAAAEGAGGHSSDDDSKEGGEGKKSQRSHPHSSSSGDAAVEQHESLSAAVSTSLSVPLKPHLSSSSSSSSDAPWNPEEGITGVPLPPAALERPFVLSALLSHVTQRPSQLSLVNSLPLYPNEQLLWDPFLLPSSSSSSSSGSSGTLSSLANSGVFPLPKLNLQYLSLSDYLLRSFALYRLESAYSIRADIVDAVRRVSPRYTLPAGASASMASAYGATKSVVGAYPLASTSSYGRGGAAAAGAHSANQLILPPHPGAFGAPSIPHTVTVFTGWSKMACPLTTTTTTTATSGSGTGASLGFKLKEVLPPRIGEVVPAKVVADVTVDLSRFAMSTRQEWDALGERDTVFLLAVRSPVPMGSTPALAWKARADREAVWRKAQGAEREGDGSPGDSHDDRNDNDNDDDDDPLFWQKHGVVAVRGAEIAGIFDADSGRSLTNPLESLNNSNNNRKDGGEAEEGEQQQRSFVSSRRTYRLLLDPAQYHQDALFSSASSSSSSTGSSFLRGLQLYEGTSAFNLLLRRRPEENNAKAVLATIRDVLNSASLAASAPTSSSPSSSSSSSASSSPSSSSPLPSWLQDALLGYGDPSSCHYSTLSALEAASASVSSSSSSSPAGKGSHSVELDFHDTFVSPQHARSCFPGLPVQFKDEETGEDLPLSSASSDPDSQRLAPPYRALFEMRVTTPAQARATLSQDDDARKRSGSSKSSLLPAAVRVQLRLLASASSPQMVTHAVTFVPYRPPLDNPFEAAKAIYSSSTGAGAGAASGGATSIRPPPPKLHNTVAFSPAQVEAIRSGMSHGLTLVAGPPGTGKTDTAVQMIVNLYHNNPNQRILLLTHSNAALNDLFAKIATRDIPERHLLRLGQGERDLAAALAGQQQAQRAAAAAEAQQQAVAMAMMTKTAASALQSANAGLLAASSALSDLSSSDASLDFSKTGRVTDALERRLALLQQVDRLGKSLAVPGDVGYTCETAGYFQLYHVVARIEAFRSKFKLPAPPTISTAQQYLKDFAVAATSSSPSTSVDAAAGASESAGATAAALALAKARTHYRHLVLDRMKGVDGDTVVEAFPFSAYFSSIAPKGAALFEKGKPAAANVEIAESCFAHLDGLFTTLASYRAFETLRSQRSRSDYLLTAQAKIVAMTVTHAALIRSRLVEELAFNYDSLVIEEAGQIMEIETFIPMTLQKQGFSTAVAVAAGSSAAAGSSGSSGSRLRRIILIGDHNQLPPVVVNRLLQRHSGLEQSMFARLIRLGLRHIQLDRQGRARPEIASLYNWRYGGVPPALPGSTTAAGNGGDGGESEHSAEVEEAALQAVGLGNLPATYSSPEYTRANGGFAKTAQFVHVGSFRNTGKGETAPQPHFYQNLGEAEFIVAVYQYMRLLGYPASSIALLTTYNGQKALLKDIVRVRCSPYPELFGDPAAIETVDKFQGQQANYVLLSLVRTKAVGHLRDVRRLVVALSRARLGLYIFGDTRLFGGCYELAPAFRQLLPSSGAASAPTTNKLSLLLGEMHPTPRLSSTPVEAAVASAGGMVSVVEVGDADTLGRIVGSIVQAKQAMMSGKQLLQLPAVVVNPSVPAPAPASAPAGGAKDEGASSNKEREAQEEGGGGGSEAGEGGGSERIRAKDYDNDE